MPEAGWYDDPTGSPKLRYFDGTDWTTQVRPLPAPAGRPAEDSARDVVQAAGSPAVAGDPPLPVSKVLLGAVAAIVVICVAVAVWLLVRGAPTDAPPPVADLPSDEEAGEPAEVPRAERAAIVNGTDIPRELFERIVESQLSGDDVGEVERAELTGDVQRNVLSTLIGIEIVADLAASEGIEVTDEELDAAFEEQIEVFEEQAEATGQDPDFNDFLETIGLSEEEYRDLIVADVVRREALTERYSEEVTDEAVRAAYDEQAEPQVDARHILVETEEEALDAISRIEGGEDFAEVAADVSLDGSGQDGGNLGVSPPSRYVPEFAEAVSDAEVNELIGPVETEFGFHVIEVLEQVEPAPFEEVEPQIRAQLRQAAEQDPELMALFEEAFTTAEVEVASGLGTWDAVSGRVVDDGEGAGGSDDPPPGGGFGITPPGPPGE